MKQSPVSHEFLYQIRPVAVKLGLLRGEELLVGLWGLFLMGLSLVLFVFVFFSNKFVNKCFETERLLLKYINQVCKAENRP